VLAAEAKKAGRPSEEVGEVSIGDALDCLFEHYYYYYF